MAPSVRAICTLCMFYADKTGHLSLHQILREVRGIVAWDAPNVPLGFPPPFLEHLYRTEVAGSFTTN